MWRIYIYSIAHTWPTACKMNFIYVMSTCSSVIYVNMLVFYSYMQLIYVNVHYIYVDMRYMLWPATYRCTYVNMHVNTFFNMQLIHLLISHLNINKLHVNIDKLHFNRNNNKNISMSTSIVAFSIFIPHADINKLQFDINTLHFACYKSYVGSFW